MLQCYKCYIKYIYTCERNFERNMRDIFHVYDEIFPLSLEKCHKLAIFAASKHLDYEPILYLCKAAALRQPVSTAFVGQPR